jgi:hypothetical protein
VVGGHLVWGNFLTGISKNETLVGVGILKKLFYCVQVSFIPTENTTRYRISKPYPINPSK